MEARRQILPHPRKTANMACRGVLTNAGESVILPGLSCLRDRPGQPSLPCVGSYPPWIASLLVFDTPFGRPIMTAEEGSLR